MFVKVAVALDGYGWHRQAWRKTLVDDPTTDSVLSGPYWAELATTAERGLLDFLCIDDDLTPQPGRRAQLSPGRLAGRADAVLTAARIAPATDHIGLIPVAPVTHTDPGRIAEAIAALDAVTDGRAGWQSRVSSTAHEAALFGRRDWPPRVDLFDTATDFVNTVRTRSGRPVVAALAHAQRIYEFACATSDLVFVTPRDDADLLAIIAAIDAIGDLGRGTPQVWADVVVTFGGDTDFGSDALIVDDSPAQVAELIQRWHDLGAAGVRLRPAVHATDLTTIVDKVVPLLQQAGRFRTAYRDRETLRERLGLPFLPDQSAEHQFVGSPS
jgi:alkanesulfonate monooxygenase SsuD/methylene tetrahydromethanopterin reductase-like flavin-dependent oxidoreductase (luciferase family)